MSRTLLSPKLLRFRIAAALLAWGIPASALASVASELIERPLVRFVLLYTEEGSALSQRIRGSVAAQETGLKALARKLESEAWTPSRAEVLRRLEHTEHRLRAKLSASATTEDALALFAEASAQSLATEAALTEGHIRFANEISERSFSAMRRRFLEAEDLGRVGANLRGRDLRETTLAGEDLRFATLNDARLGDLTGADLRGADLRGAGVSEDTALRGAIYDQYTGLPFATREAAERGMIYSPTPPPESFARVDVKASRRKASAAAAVAPKRSENIPQQALNRLTADYPHVAKGVELYRRPRRLIRSGDEYASRFEAGVLVSAPKERPQLRDLIHEVRQHGGEVRRLVSTHPKTGKVIKTRYAEVSFEGRKPIVSIGYETSDEVIVHEREHFRDWIALLRKYENQGFTELGAHRKAMSEFNSPAFTAETERNAIHAELKARAAADDAAGVPLALREYRFEGQRLAYLMAYPELQALNDLLLQNTYKEIMLDSALRAEAEGYARSVARAGLRSRRAHFRILKLDSAADVNAEELFHFVASGNVSRLTESGNYPAVVRIFRRVLPDEVALLPDDEFKTALLKALAR